MSKLKKSFPYLMLGAGLLMGLLVGVGMMIGVWYAAKQHPSPAAELKELFETRLHAAGAHGGKSMVMATGPIDDDVEGLFVVDNLTGDLYCWVVFSRTLGGGFVGQYKYNVAKDLGVQEGKTPDYVMVVGGVQTIRGGAVARPAKCVVYVGDSNTGNVAAYSLLWNLTSARDGAPQRGTLTLVAAGKVRPDAETDQ